jgi:hypothetical protein
LEPLYSPATRGQCYDFKTISAKIWRKKLAILTQIAAFGAENYRNIAFQEKRHLSEN